MSMEKEYGMEQMKAAYENIEIPKELLLQRVEGAIRKGRRRARPASRRLLRTAAALAAALLLCILPLNTVPGLAASLEGIPLVGHIAKVLTFRTFSVSDPGGHYDLAIEVPQLSGIEYPALQDSLNAAYLTEATEWYDHFLEEIGGLQEGQMANRAVNAGYQVVVDDGQLLVLRRYVVEEAGSSMETALYDTIDVELGALVTLPGLFNNDSYLAIISSEVLSQMEQRMDEDESQIFYVGGDYPDGFSQITPDQKFYVNENRRLVMVFDEYSIAPGYMGTVEFEIPTQSLTGILAGDRYLR